MKYRVIEYFHNLMCSELIVLYFLFVCWALDFFLNGLVLFLCINPILKHFEFLISIKGIKSIGFGA